MENQIQQNQFTNQESGLSVDHVKQLEGFLGAIMSNQEIIIEQNKEMLSANRNRKIWAIAKAVLLFLLVVVPMFFLPQILSSMTEQITSNMDMGGLAENLSKSGGSELNIDMEKISELERLLNQ
jgi:predicted nucleic acid-binding Zn ribbon protein